ncbi:HutD family protein [Clostridium sp. OS1-26]|uniref:HutD/Ves family protein n=1 Tax=Clostridium sp. OS1-26 TaxID=3070681 RepID=UPI0027E1EC6C|nr:HutD family protein [Clostridium sp. OS1-26]WML34804.1 HutD family protein [Clostridium sp. OS1-26]
METKINLIRKNEFQISRWSGGTTTELLIYPEEAKYSERNFKWRLSSAKVEVNESEFTYLPGISRIIMIIDGKLTLEHKGHHKAVLGVFEQDSFMGDWETKSSGIVTDFNLMMNEECTGKLQALSFKTEDTIKILLNESSKESNQITDAFYIVQGSIQIAEQDKVFEVNEGELLSVTRENNESKCELSIYNKGDKEAKIIRTTIFY